MQARYFKAIKKNPFSANEIVFNTERFNRQS